jgi:ectoine hydroxylase-related dioxygenase (phytanoyl-CoA dioxygenase family)
MSRPPLSDQQLDDLSLQGYLVVPKVLDSYSVVIGKHFFYQFLPDVFEKEQPSHGVISSFYAGHSRFAWFCRTQPKVQAIFKQLLGCTDLVVSFDGCGYHTVRDRPKRNSIWVHSDQSPNKVGLHCYQSLLSFTDNHESTFQCVPASHNQHHLFSQGELWQNELISKDYQRIPNHLKADFWDRLVTIPVMKGDLLLWDSRLLHQNRYAQEVRIVQYLSYLDRDKMTVAQVILLLT